MLKTPILFQAFLEESVNVTFKVGRFWNLDFFHAIQMFGQAKTCIASVGVSEAFLVPWGRVSEYLLAFNVMWGPCAMCVSVESGVISATGSEESRP